MYKLVISTLIGAIMVSSTALAQSMDPKAECNRYADTWRAAYNKGDAEFVANSYDPKSGTYIDLTWTGTGHDALLAGFKNVMTSMGQVNSIVCEHSNRMGNKAVADGTWEGKGKGPDGKEATFQGHWMSVSEMRDGKWVILTHLSNVDTLTPSAPK